MVDENDSGERRIHKLEMDITKAVSEMTSAIDRMPLKLEISLMKAIKAQKKECDEERERSAPDCGNGKTKPDSSAWTNKIILGLIAALTAALGVIGTMAAS
jgi:hypothetical protein